MTDTPGYTKPASPRDIDFAHYFRHYAALLWRWKWWFVFATPVAGCIAVMFLLHALKNPVLPSLPATVTLGGALGSQPNASMVKVTNEGSGDESDAPDTLAQTALIRSRDFLRGVANDLSLRLNVTRYSRSSVFDSVSVDSTAPSGKYRFVIDRKGGARFSVYRKDSVLGLRSIFHRDLAACGSMDTLTGLQLPGVHLRFSRTFLQHPFDCKFTVANILETVESLRDSVSVHSSPPTGTQQYPSFSITKTGTDYQQSAATVNTIADKFVERNVRLRETRSQNIRDILKEQLEKAKAELAESEENLKAFRMENPSVGLSQNSEEILSSTAKAERTSDSVEESINNALLLQKKLAGAAKQNLPQVCSEILGFLVVQKNNAAPFLASELTRLIGESHHLEAAFDMSHPMVQKNQADIRQVIEKTTFELQNFIESQQQEQALRQNEVTTLSRKMHALPSEELNLGELTRLQQIKADIYARLLDKFYQTSVSSVTDMPDFYVMDYASPPMPPPSRPDKKVLVMCMFFVMGVLLFPVAVADFVAKTVRSEVELRKLLEYDILESIPKITPKKRAGSGAARPGLSTALIVDEAEIDPDYAKELFRLLRMKIMFRFQAGGLEKTLVVTSLESNAGKSTIASNIAIAMAQQNLKTVLVDGDMRLGTIHHLFNLDKSPGLSEFLSGDRAAASPSSIALHHPGGIPNLTVITSGKSETTASELLSSDRFGHLVRTLVAKYDIVIFDSPPISIVADALTVNRLFSHYLLVIKAGQTNIVDLRDKITENAELRSKLMGVVLNFAAIDRKMRYYKHSKYYFQSQPKPGA